MTEDKFRRVWSYLPVDYRTWPSKLVPQTQTLTVKADYATRALRLLFTNENGVMPLELAALQLTVTRGGQRVDTQPILIRGRNELWLGLDERTISDTLTVAVEPGDELTIVAMLPHTTYLTSGVVTYSKLNYQNVHQRLDGSVIDPRQQFIMVKNNHRMNYFFGVYGIEMQIPEDKQVITVFGDSIVQQGFFPNHLRQALQTTGANQFAVNNAGIGGNRVLFDTDPIMDEWYRHGIAGVKRFEHDVFDHADPNQVIVFHGVNDVIQETIHPGDQPEDLAQVQDGLTEYARIIHAHDAKALICTLMPLHHSQFYSAHVEQQRQVMNEWITKQTVFDRVIDLNSAMGASDDPTALDARYDSGDGLHPSDAGGAQMAEVAKAVILAK